MPDPHPLDAGATDQAAGAPRWRWLRWVAGLALGLVVVGPGLASGALLSLDLLVTPEIPVPNGMWGLGPGLTQRVPFFGLVAAGSAVLGGPVAVKALIVVLVAVAFVGAGRLVRPRGSIAAEVAVGIVWAAGPFALTRIGVGHVSLLWTLAVLPWVLPRLCRPSAVPEATFLGAVALAFGGPSGGTLGLAVVAIGLLTEPREGRRPVAVVVLAALANLVWILPTLSVLWAGADVAASGDFATRPVGVAGWPALLAGGGFWQPGFQVGTGGWLGGAVGVLLLGLALIGQRDLDPRWARGGRAVGLAGLVLAVASAVPGVRVAYEAVSDLPFGAPLRESQRFLALWLIWAAPAAALGAARLADRVAAGRGDEPSVARRGFASVAALVPVALALAVSAPGWWGIEGRLAPRTFPAGWAEARALVRAEPGPAVAFPWSEYPPLSFAGGRQVFNPVPDVFGGDVISSYDPVFDRSRPSQEQVDRRAVIVDALSDRAVDGLPISTDLRELGVRWVILVHEAGHEAYRGLPSDPGLRVALEHPDVTLYEVTGWRGPVEGPDGTATELDRPIPPVLRVPGAAEGAVVDVAGAPGWVRGWGTPVPVTDDGRLEVPAGSGPLWFWPAVIVVVGDLVVLGAVAVAVVRLRRRGRPAS